MERQHDQIPPREAIEALLHRDHYTVDEAAYILGIHPEVIYRAAQRHDLKAYVVDHAILDIHRDDLLQWLDNR